MKRKLGIILSHPKEEKEKSRNEQIPGQTMPGNSIFSKDLCYHSQPIIPSNSFSIVHCTHRWKLPFNYEMEFLGLSKVKVHLG